MGKFLQKYGILFFFCAMMGGIIMVDSIFAICYVVQHNTKLVCK